MIQISRLFRIAVLSFAVLVVSGGMARGQYFTLGNDPAHARWKQIKSENFTLIYPSEIDSLAREYLWNLEFRRASVFKSAKNDGKPIPVVLHPYTTLSNGAVSWAPRRIDLFTTPEAYKGLPDPWIDQLSTHELRHQVQMEAFRRGGTGAWYYPLGECVIPLWAWLYMGRANMEGDAVITETELLDGGRGRSADFTRYYRMAFLTGDKRDMYHFYNSSFRKFTPDRYAFGYQIMSSARLSTADYCFTGKRLNFSVDNWINLPLVLDNYRVLTGHRKRELWNMQRSFLTDCWQKDLEARGKLTVGRQVISKEPRLHTEYTSPVPITDSSSRYCGSIIAIKSGMEECAKLVSVSEDGRERLVASFASKSSDLEVAGGYMYWTERVMRGGSTLEDFSVLRRMDLKTGKVEDFPDRKTKWFNPAVSPDGRIIAVTEYPVEGSSFLVLIDSHNGKILKRIEGPRGGQIKESAFVGNEIYASIIVRDGLGLFIFSKDGWKEVLPPQNHSVDHLRSTRDLIYFCSDIDGVENIYTFRPGDENPVRITNSRFGADYPFMAGDGSLYCSDFGQNGFRVINVPKDSLDSSVVRRDDAAHYPVAEMLTEQRRKQGGVRPDSSSVPDFRDKNLYPSKSYSRFTHLWHVHSWAPFYYNVDNVLSLTLDRYYDVASLGAVVYSQNTLGTAVTMLGYSAHTAPDPSRDNGKKWFHSGHASFTYKGICPYIEAAVDFNDRLRIHNDGVNTEHEGTAWSDTTRHYITDTYPMYVCTRLRLYYPICFNKGGWNRTLLPQLSWNYFNDEYVSPEGSAVWKNQFTGGVSYTQTRPIAHSQIYPRWGFSLTAMASAAHFSEDAFGELGYLYGYLYLPGVIRTQGLKLTCTWQKQFVDSRQYLLSSLTSMPKGYKYSYPTTDFVKATASYAAPIYLGDVFLGAGMGIHLKRLQLIPFYEWARDVNRSGEKRYFSSVGTDLLLDFSISPIELVFSVGFRYSHTGADYYWTKSGLKDAGRDTFSFIFNVAL